MNSNKPKQQSTNPDALVVPTKSAKDVAHALLKATMSTIPGVGGLVSELLTLLVQPPLERRQDEWRQSVAVNLARLSSMNLLDLESLKSNDEFLDTLLHATQIALRNHQEEKLLALRNAILNTAMDPDPSALRRHVFLRYIDEFSSEQVAVLRFFDNPKDWFTRNKKPLPNMWAGSRYSVLSQAFPALTREDELCNHIWKDLYQRGLVSVDNLKVSMRGGGTLASCTTELGRAFLKFVRSHEFLS